MKEIIDIVAAFDEANVQGKKVALATVVLVEGSAYRRAGARMLITEDGRLTGAISGGCLEGDALRKARLVIMQQEPMLVTYDTMDDDDAKLGVGLGCNGIIHILIEPITENPQNPINLLKSIIESRGNAVLVTLFCLADKKAAQPGTCICLTKNGMDVKATENPANLQNIKEIAKQVFEGHQSRVETSDGFTAFIDYVKPLVAVVIVGAGNDAIPLTKMAAVLGWNITVIDGRHNYALPERFPSAQKIIVATPENVLAQLELTQWTAFVLMTHNYNYELALLNRLLPLNLPYVGVLGPKKKLDRMLNELEAKSGIEIPKEQLSKLYGPVGLDIGSETPEEIALSIIAEIKAILTGRQGNSLRYKPVPIHAEPVKMS